MLQITLVFRLTDIKLFLPFFFFFKSNIIEIITAAIAALSTSLAMITWKKKEYLYLVLCKICLLCKQKNFSD